LKKLPVKVEGESPKLDIAAFVSAIIFDRNSQVCLHNTHAKKGIGKNNRARTHAFPVVQ